MNLFKIRLNRTNILNTSIKSIVIASSVVILSNCRGRVPIQETTSLPIPMNAQYLSEDDIRSSIIHTASNRKWHCSESAPQTLKCHLKTRGHEAEIDIHYSKKEYSITHRGSKNLHETEGEIHPKFNKWVHKLEEDIYRNLENS